MQDDSINSMVLSERSHHHHHHVYVTRWYIILLFSFTAFVQGLIWNMWGPIYASCIDIFDWSDSQIALMPFYGSILLTVLALPSAMFVERCGLRKLMLLMSALNLGAPLLRCLPFRNQLTTTIFANLSSIINGIAGVPTFFMPSYIASRWFPKNERRFAAAIGLQINGLGVCGSFLFGPMLVHEPWKGVTKDDMLREYHHYTYLQTGVSALLFIMALIYYPDSPPTPPSETATRERVDYLAGCRQLFSSAQFWLFAWILMLVNASVLGWGPVLDIDLKSQHVDQWHSGYIGFYGGVGGIVGGLIFGKLGDLYGHLKALQIACVLWACIGSGWLVLIMKNFIPFGIVQAYICVILLTTAGSALTPVNFEMAVECLYPIDEAITVGILGALGSFWSSIFLALNLIKSIGSGWMDWFLVVACFSALPLAIVIGERYRRSEIDISDDDTSSTGHSNDNF